MSLLLLFIHKVFLLCKGFVLSYFVKEESSNYPIDFVVTWLDDSDPVWQMSKRKYDSTNVDKDDCGDERYRDWDTFRYWFRSVEKYAPWVNKIYLVTCGHVPPWLNLNHPKLVHVKHSDYMDPDYLPTFNSASIEINLHKIKAISEHFVSFNDDVFLINPVCPEDFFYNGVPLVCNVARPIINKPINEPFYHILFSMVGLMNGFDWLKIIEEHSEKWFSHKIGKDLRYNWEAYVHGYITGFYYTHLALALRKSTMREVWTKFGNELENTSRHKFRVNTDVNPWLFSLYEIVRGTYMPIPRHFYGYYRQIHEIDLIENDIKNRSCKQICLNDTKDVKKYNETRKRIKRILELKFPNPSSFENEESLFL